jgi:hypothetical protein
MQYSTRIEDYLAAIEGCEAFFVAEREHFKIINYISMGNDVFPDPNTAPDAETARKWLLRRQCRGLIFSYAGDVISLPIHKFFNVSERDETQLHKIDLDRQHVILSKLDGCLSADTVVDTPYGKMTMKDICMSDTDIPVRAYDHQTRQDVWAQVQGTSVKESADNWYRVTLDDGRTIELTDNHKVWCVNKKVYLTVGDLEEDDEVQLLNE